MAAGLESAYEDFLQSLFEQIAIPIEAVLAEILSQLQSAAGRLCQGETEAAVEGERVWCWRGLQQLRLDPSSAWAGAEALAGGPGESVNDRVKVPVLLAHVLRVLSFARAGSNFVLRPMDVISSKVPLPPATPCNPPL